MCLHPKPHNLEVSSMLEYCHTTQNSVISACFATSEVSFATPLLQDANSFIAKSHICSAIDGLTPPRSCYCWLGCIDPARHFSFPGGCTSCKVWRACRRILLPLCSTQIRPSCRVGYLRFAKPSSVLSSFCCEYPTLAGHTDLRALVKLWFIEVQRLILSLISTKSGTQSLPLSRVGYLVWVCLTLHACTSRLKFWISDSAIYH